MSIVRAENFTDYDLPSTPTSGDTVRPILYSTGRIVAAGTASNATSAHNIALKVPDGAYNDPEGRRWLNWRVNSNITATYYFGFTLNTPVVPEAVGDVIFTSFRVIPMLYPGLSGTTNDPGAGREFVFSIISAASVPANTTPGSYLIRQQGHTMIPAQGGTISEDIVNLSSATRVPIQFDVKIERIAAGTIRVNIWCNDVPVTTDFSIAAGSNYRYAWIGSYKTSTGTVSTPMEFYIDDIIVVKVDGVGHNYRMGPTARVQNVLPTSDLIAQWKPPGDVAAPHYPYMSRLYKSPLDTDGLLADEMGLTESYGFSDLDPALGSKVYAVLLEMMQSNAGSAIRQIELIKDATVVSTQPSAPNVTPNMLTYEMQTNPTTGQAWTQQEVNSLVMGYRLKTI